MPQKWIKLIIILRLSLTFVTFTPPFFCASQLNVDLRNPSFENGTFSTEEGGVIQGDDLRIQAQSIAYMQKEEDKIQKVEAEGDLMVEYKGRAYIGKKIAFDLTANEGILYEGKMAASDLFMGGDKIYLHADGTFEIDGATFTNSPNRNSSWDIHAEKIQGKTGQGVSLQNPSLHLFQKPIVPLPSMNWSFPKSEKESEIHTVFNFSGNPSLSMRYPLYSFENLKFFSRLEYAFVTDVGAALETEYAAPQASSKWATQNFICADLKNTKNLHYRLKGEHFWESVNQKTTSVLTWDKSGDAEIADSSFGKEFSVNPSGENLFWLHHQEPFALFNMKVHPHLHSFEQGREELPSLSLHFLPKTLGTTGIFAQSQINASFLRYSSLEAQAGKARFEQHLFKPLQLGPCHLTPFAKAIGTFATDSPSHQANFLGIGGYGLNIKMDGKKVFSDTLHHMQPYAAFSAAFSAIPATNLIDSYIFSIQDGYQPNKQARIGLRNHFFSLEEPSTPFLSTDFFANALFPNLPTLHFNFSSQLPSLFFSFNSQWNITHSLFDQANALCKWTLNQDIALIFEARYRSSYFWKKADPENFFLEAAKSESELLLSPLSDRRITILGSLFFKIPPFWELTLSSQQGFYRLLDPPYQKWKLDLTTKITPKMKLLFSYNFSDKGHEFTTDFSLN